MRIPKLRTRTIAASTMDFSHMSWSRHQRQFRFLRLLRLKINSYSSVFWEKALDITRSSDSCCCKSGTNEFSCCVDVTTNWRCLQGPRRWNNGRHVDDWSDGIQDTSSWESLEVRERKHVIYAISRSIISKLYSLFEQVGWKCCKSWCKWSCSRMWEK